MGTFILYQSEAMGHIMQRDTIKYLRQHNVDVKTQVQVLSNIHETGQMRNVQHHFLKLMSEELPPELRRTICEELWAHRLQSLELISVIATWVPSFIRELAQIVREETHASNAIVCKQGDVARTAYMIIQGQLKVFTLKVIDIPIFTDGMWLGEKVLISANLHRSGSIVTQTTSRLMTLPGLGFHQLLEQNGLVNQFRELCTEEVSRGCCGRCGSLGNHFSDRCPLLGPRKVRTSVVQEWLRGSAHN